MTIALWAAALAAAASSASAQSLSSGTLRLALIEEAPFNVSIRLGDPLERLLKVSPSSGAILDVQTLPCRYSGGDFSFSLPGENGALTDAVPAVALEADSETALVFPPAPDLIEGLARLARDPASYPSPWSIQLSSRALRLDPPAGNSRWRNTAAMLYRLRWNGQDVSVLLVGRVSGGLGRMATALREEIGANGPLIGVARGGLFSSPLPDFRGTRLVSDLEALGLRYSAVGNSEIRHWPEFSFYRSSHPAGVQFLSANLVYSSAPAVTLLPDSVIASVGELRVGFIGLTPPSASKYLGQAGLAQARILDSEQALEARLPALRRKADAVVLLVERSDEFPFLAQQARGIDVIIGRDESSHGASPAPESRIAQSARPQFLPPLWLMRAYPSSLGVLEARMTARGGAFDWNLNERHRLLDAALAEAPGFPEFDPQAYGISPSSEPALIPSARQLFAGDAGPSRQVKPREFWAMAASLAAQSTGAEVALLRVWPLAVQVKTAVAESLARIWLQSEEPALTFMVKGRDLKPLLAEAEIQRQREDKNLPLGGLPRYAFGGVEPGFKIHGVPLEDELEYRVVTSRVLADALGLSSGRALHLVGRTIDQIVLDELRWRAGSPPSRYRDWMEGRPVEARGLWKLNFRDIGLNIQNTKVARDDAFNAVPNSRIQGFDELLVGGVLKTDAEYLKQPYRWINTIEMEYARSRLRPRDQPPVTNTTANRITLLTSGTRRAGLIHEEWFARSYGPSLGLAFDGQFEASPGLRRKQIYSAYPGVSFYDGTWVRSFELSGNIKRDLSRDPPNTQTGLHSRLLVSKDIGAAPVTLQGELFTNYFFLTRADTAQDLRVEGAADLKLRVPLRKHLTVAPFFDFYFFALKTRRLWGYSAMMGVQIGFSRLWKPQYESLLGDR